MCSVAKSLEYMMNVVAYIVLFENIESTYASVLYELDVDKPGLHSMMN